MSDLSRLFRKLADEEDAIRARTSDREALRRRLASLPSASAARRSARLRYLGAAVAAAALALSALLLVPMREPDVLGVRVGKSSAPPLIDTWLGAPDHEPLPLQFSDGTRMALAPKARARLREVRPEGARVELAHGSLRVEVKPRAATNFRIESGPFSVRITGTRFDVRFDPNEETFTLALEEGHVVLSGCVFGSGRPLAAGQSVRASCKKRTLDIGYGDRLYREAPQASASGAPPSRSNAGAPVEQPVEHLGSAASARVVKDPASSVAPDVSADGWLALAKRGDYARAFERARAGGFEAQCARTSSDELALLADVARHAGAPREARYALLTLRRRFPGTDPAALAAFTLGRLEFDGRRSYPGAIEWFRTYLNERPRGPMTREALGRLIEALRATGDLAGARALARRYVREYPSGPHAELASRVLAAP